MSDKQQAFDVPPQLRRGGSRGKAEKYVEEGRDLLAYMSDTLGLPDLGTSDVLDVGCGTKFTEAILKYGIVIGSYTGIDVYKPMIDHLGQTTNDPRFTFHHMNTHNEMYNPEGETLGPDIQLPVGDQQFDIICLYSVFTHLAPHDYANMLHVLRPYIREGGKLIFSLFVDERSGTGYGLLEDIVGDASGDWQPSGQPFRDAYPGKPLQWALYSREHAFELIEGTGWKVEDLLMPNAYVQHHFVCTPA